MNTSKGNRMFIVAVPILMVITMVLVASVWAGSGSFTKTLPNNQSVDIGILTVWHDETAVYVEYNTMSAQELDIPDGWEIAETRLAIGGIRQASSDDLMPGQFPFHEKHDPPIRKYTYIVEFNEWDADPDEFYVAAQAVLVSSDGMETEWSEESEGCPSSLEWATYFNYTVTPAEDEDENGPERAKEFSELKLHTMMATAQQH
jgi:hypothetical protein